MLVQHGFPHINLHYSLQNSVWMGPTGTAPIHIKGNTHWRPRRKTDWQRWDLKLLKIDLQRAYADTHRCELSSNVGDYVFLLSQPYRQNSLTRKRYEKLSPRFFGLYKIIRKVGSVAYELELLKSSRVHPIFHVSLIRPAKGHVPVAAPPVPLSISAKWELVLNPVKVISHCWIKEGDN